MQQALFDRESIFGTCYSGSEAKVHGFSRVEEVKCNETVLVSLLLCLQNSAKSDDLA